MIFDHVGYRTTEKKEGEFFFAPNRVWITDSKKHPFNIEWLRYENDSPVKEPVKSSPHIGFRVENLETAMTGMEILLGPMEIDSKKRIVFCKTEDGAVVELMEIHS
ncbi:hypothetical protein H0R92_04215 [Treponema sp. OMZ 840]|uniref:VOC family protein n=1 Tax=Treponema sp. OMZ 840 TaxID=244313 RepID=UPI003D8BEF7F